MDQKSSDEELVKLARTGDSRAFTLLVERHYMTVYKFAYKYAGSREDAEDIAQDACMKLGRSIDTYRGDSAFTTWLYRLVINVAKDYMRKKRRTDGRELPIFDDFEMPAAGQNQEKRMMAADVLKAVNDLPEKLRDAILLVCWEGLSHAEAGKILDCAESTVSWRVHEARKQLGEKIEKDRRYG